MRRLLVCGVICAGAALAQSAGQLALREWRERHERYVLDQLFELLRLPPGGSDASELRRNAEAVADLFKRAGFKTTLWSLSDAPPVVIAEHFERPGLPWVVLYNCYDPPVEGRRDSPLAEFTRPVLLSGPRELGGRPIPLPSPGWPSDPEWLVQGRALQQRLPFVALSVAWEALRTSGWRPRYNLRILVEGEGYRGSNQLQRLLRQNPALANVDAWILLVGSQPRPPLWSVCFGVPTYLSVELAIYAHVERSDLGQTKSSAPGPATLLVHLLATLRDESGQLRIRGLEDLPAAPGTTRRSTASRFSAQREPAGRLNDLPWLEIVRLDYAGTEASDRSRAVAWLVLEMPAGWSWHAVADRLMQHIRNQGFYVTASEPSWELRRARRRVCRLTIREARNGKRTSSETPFATGLCSHLEGWGKALEVNPYCHQPLPGTAWIEQVRGSLAVVPLAFATAAASGEELVRLADLWEEIDTAGALLSWEPPALAAETPRTRQMVRSGR